MLYSFSSITEEEGRTRPTNGMQTFLLMCLHRRYGWKCSELAELAEKFAEYFSRKCIHPNLAFCLPSCSLTHLHSQSSSISLHLPPIVGLPYVPMYWKKGRAPTFWCSGIFSDSDVAASQSLPYDEQAPNDDEWGAHEQRKMRSVGPKRRIVAKTFC